MGYSEYPHSGNVGVKTAISSTNQELTGSSLTRFKQVPDMSAGNHYRTDDKLLSLGSIGVHSNGNAGALADSDHSIIHHIVVEHYWALGSAKGTTALVEVLGPIIETTMVARHV